LVFAGLLYFKKITPTYIAAVTDLVNSKVIKDKVLLFVVEPLTRYSLLFSLKILDFLVEKGATTPPLQQQQQQQQRKIKKIGKLKKGILEEGRLVWPSVQCNRI